MPASPVRGLAAVTRYAITGVNSDIWFGPQLPLAPQAALEMKGRWLDYAVGVYLSYIGQSEAGISFAELPALVDGLPLLHAGIETHKFRQSPVEQIARTINIAPSRDTATLDYYRMGSVPDSLATLLKEWTVDQIRQFQDYFDALMVG